MPCYRPIEGYRRADGAVSFRRDGKTTGQLVTVPCGQCIGCRLDRAKGWAIRCVHESKQHDDNAFLTLTYDDDNLPYGNTLVPQHHTDFMKRYRKKCGKLRFYMVGEYGEETSRPHYHYLIFGHQFEDRYLFNLSKSGEPQYRSPTLEKLWPYGHATIGELTYESAAYCARYALKKFSGDGQEEHYAYVHPCTGEYIKREPEFARMSNRPGIGADWFEQFGTTDLEGDYIAFQGRKLKVPPYYDKLLERVDEFKLDIIKQNRRAKFRRHKADNTRERLDDREKVVTHNLKRLKREL